MTLLVFLVFAVLLGLIPAAIAKGKGRSFGLWWFYGAMVFIVALPHALLLETDISAIEKQQMGQGMKKCQFCAELVKQDAIVCRYCGRDLPKSELSGYQTSDETNPRDMTF